MKLVGRDRWLPYALSGGAVHDVVSRIVQSVAAGSLGFGRTEGTGSREIAQVTAQ